MNEFPIREVILLEKEEGYELIVYLDEHIWDSELAKEFGEHPEQTEKLLLHWIKRKYPSIKIRTVKVFIGSMIVGTMLINPYQQPVEAASTTVLQMMPIDIFINGKKLDLIDHPYVSYERTLIPIRDIAEALGATVVWHQDTKEVTVTLGDRSLLLKVDSKQVLANGRWIESDVKTQIINSRTYVPLRLVSEHLGATVTWQQASRSILIELEANEALYVDAIHAYTVVDYKGDPTALRSLQASGLQISSTSTFAHLVQEDGTITAPYGVNQAALDYANNLGLPNYMLIHNFHGGTFTKEVVKKVLTDTDVRKKLVDEILRNITLYGYDGVEVDFEGIGGTEREQFTAFLRELKDRLLAENLTLMIALPAKTVDNPKDNWSGGYDYVAIGQIVDRVMIMSYDEHWAGGSPGPISSLPWFEKVAAYVSQTIPANKVLMGIPLYAYDWPEKGNARALLPVGVDNLVKKYGGVIEWDPKSSTPFYKYTDASGVKHEVWFEDNVSITQKVQVVKNYNFKGVGLWRLGYEKQELWQAIQIKQERIPT